MNAIQIPAWTMDNVTIILVDFPADAHMDTRENAVTLRFVQIFSSIYYFNI